LLPDPFFDLPQVGRLTGKGRAMDAAQGREELSEVATKVTEHRFVLIQSQVLDMFPVLNTSR